MKNKGKVVQLSSVIERKKRKVVPFIVLITVLVPVTAAAGEAESAAGLRFIMQDLGGKVRDIAEGISREDWHIVNRLALRIAEHPKPPMNERVKLLAHLGSEAKNFQRLDSAAHDSAMTLSAAAARSDGDAVIAAFGELQRACYSCHKLYRKGIQSSPDRAN